MFYVFIFSYGEFDVAWHSQRKLEGEKETERVENGGNPVNRQEIEMFATTKEISHNNDDVLWVCMSNIVYIDLTKLYSYGAPQWDSFEMTNFQHNFVKKTAC